MRQVREVPTLEVEPERVKTGALGHVPNPDALVLAVAQDQLLPARDKSKDNDNDNDNNDKSKDNDNEKSAHLGWKMAQLTLL